MQGFRAKRAKHAEYASTALGKRFLNFYAVLTASIGIKRVGVAADQIPDE